MDDRSDEQLGFGILRLDAGHIERPLFVGVDVGHGFKIARGFWGIEGSRQLIAAESGMAARGGCDAVHWQRGV
ncbi:MAG: hypothetical protein WCK86_15590 [Planctomycetia bacterium]